MSVCCNWDYGTQYIWRNGLLGVELEMKIMRGLGAKMFELVEPVNDSSTAFSPFPGEKYYNPNKTECLRMLGQ